MTNTEYAESLRRLADMLEENPKVPISTSMPFHYIYTCDAAEYAKACAAVSGATGYVGDNMSTSTVAITEYRTSYARIKVEHMKSCRRVEIGEEEIVVPEQKHVAEHKIKVPIYSTVCE